MKAVHRCAIRQFEERRVRRDTQAVVLSQEVVDDRLHRWIPGIETRATQEICGTHEIHEIHEIQETTDTAALIAPVVFHTQTTDHAMSKVPLRTTTCHQVLLHQAEEIIPAILAIQEIIVTEDLAVAE